MLQNHEQKFPKSMEPYHGYLGSMLQRWFDPDISAPNLPLIHAQCPPNLVQALRQSLGGGYPGRAGTASSAPSGPADGCTTNPLFAKLLGSQKPEMMMLKMMMKIMLFHDVKWVKMKIRR